MSAAVAQRKRLSSLSAVAVRGNTSRRISSSSKVLAETFQGKPIKKSHPVRRFFIYSTVLGTLTVSSTTLLALNNDTVRDTFEETLPGAKTLFATAEDRGWDQIGLQDVIKAGQQGVGAIENLYMTYFPSSSSPSASSAVNTISEATTSAKAAAAAKAAAIREEALKLKADVQSKTTEVKDKVSKAVKEAEKRAKEAVGPATSALNKGVSDLEKIPADALDKVSTLNSASPKSDVTYPSLFAPKTTKQPLIRGGDVSAAENFKGKDLGDLRPPPPPPAPVAPSPAVIKAKEVEKKVEGSAEDAKKIVKDQVNKISAEAQQKASEAQSKASALLISAQKASTEVVTSAQDKAANLVSSAKSTAADVKNSTLDAADQAQEKVQQWSEDVKELAEQAEVALGKKVHEVKESIPSPPTTDVKDGGPKVWSEPLPLGHSIPSGYAPPPKKLSSSTGSVLHQKLGDAVVAPKVPSIASTLSGGDEIVKQLAGTIDSLAKYVERTPTVIPSAVELLSHAQTELETLSTQISSARSKERDAAAVELKKKKDEFEEELKRKEAAWAGEVEKKEAGWAEEVKIEKDRLRNEWRERMEKDEVVRNELTERRLKEEVIAQGIELQKRWIREIKTRVETERGGRLSKIQELETGLKKLEELSLDNVKVLDENVRVHTLWSALRAVQTALASPSKQPFSGQLAALKSTVSTTPDSVSSVALSSIPSSVASSGVESVTHLTNSFLTKIAPSILSVSLVPDSADAGVLSHVASIGLSKFMFKKDGFPQGDDVRSVVARAEWYLLQKGDLDSAAREINSLRGWAGKVSQDWLRSVRQRLEVEQAIEIAATEAKLASLKIV